MAHWVAFSANQIAPVMPASSSRRPLFLTFCGMALIALAVLASGQASAADPLAQIRAMPRASLLVKERGRELIAHRADTLRVPASTIKLLTALAAVETWGRHGRLQTDFLRSDDGWLWVKGRADPYLVSEELDRIAAALRQRGLRQVTGIGLDDSFFAPAVEIAGRSNSDNPYDAPVTALAANFNTLNLLRSGARVRTAETQTPLTPIAERLGRAGANGSQRVNLRERDLAVGYFGELLAAKLRAAGIQVGNNQKIARTPHGAALFYRHTNSRNLEDMLKPMLEYSNNFIANALFLRLADPDGQRGQVDSALARRALSDFARQRFGWHDFSVADGAGLSRRNRLSARQLVDVVEAFAPYRDLLPAQTNQPKVRAKTGTLRGVSCYAGFVRREGIWEPFALLIEQPVDARLRKRVANALAR